MESERTRFIYNGEYYTGDIRIATPPKEPEPEPEQVVIIEEAKNEIQPQELEPVVITEEPKQMFPHPPPESMVAIADKAELVPELVPEPRKINELGIDKTTKIHLSTFEILRIRVLPHKSATIDIVIKADKHDIERTVLLSGSAYTNWSSDDNYVYDYVHENIDKIYDNEANTSEMESKI